MTVIRATKLLGHALGVTLAPATERDADANIKLGEWYGNVIPSSIGILVVLLNAPTRLALVTQILHPVRLIRELPRRLERLLIKLGVPDDAVQREVNGFEPVAFTKTVDRRFIGSLNEVCHQIAWRDEDHNLRGGRGLDDLEDDLAHLVHLPLPETVPEDAVRARLGGVNPRSHSQ